VPSTSTASDNGISSHPPAEEREANVLDLVVLHAAPLVIKDSKGRLFPMEKLDLAAERRAIVSSLVNEVSHKAIHLRFDVATADILRSLMTAWRCKVLHFSGHGLGQNPALCFEDGAGCTHMITPDLLRQLTFSGLTPRGDDRMSTTSVPPISRQNHHLQLVFVNSCHSQKVASVFLNAGIPHVIAVRYMSTPKATLIIVLNGWISRLFYSLGTLRFLGRRWLGDDVCQALLSVVVFRGYGPNGI
jgi:hypothetical protein